MNNLRMGFEVLLDRKYPKWKLEMLDIEIDVLYTFYCSGYVEANANLVNHVQAMAVVRGK